MEDAFINKTHLKTKTNFFKEFFKQLSKFGEDVVIICHTACSHWLFKQQNYCTQRFIFYIVELDNF